MPIFKAYIGIDYSGAKTPNSRLRGLQVFMSHAGSEPKKVRTPVNEGWNWTRKEIALWCVEQLRHHGPMIIGIDHGFSLPMSYMEQYRISNWDHFLEDFQTHWPTDEDGSTVEKLRHGNNRTGPITEYRLTEKWTSSTQSVFKLDGQGIVGKSTHTGIPWLRYIRRQMGHDIRPHFWPFDGFEINDNTSVVAEIYPSILRRRYARQFKSTDEHDAWCVAKWLRDLDANGFLQRYFSPPLKPVEKKQALIEGWILGVY